MKPITGLSPKELSAALAAAGYAKTFYAGIILEWVYRKNILSFSEITSLPLELRKYLSSHYSLCSVKKAGGQVSKADGTKKYLFELKDGLLTESVLIKEPEYLTMCLSSQSGCPLACSFCRTGEGGFYRDLEFYEIADQALYIKRDNAMPALQNIVFMGQGEPLLNAKNLIKALGILTAGELAGLGSRRITVSTSGWIENFREVYTAFPEINFAFSLNFPDDRLRSTHMPVNKKFNIKSLIQAIKLYEKETGKRVSIEYVLLDGINTAESSLQKLCFILKGLKCHLNLIPYNSISPGTAALSPSNPAVRKVYNYFIKNGINATVRKSRGSDIKAACGMLASLSSSGDKKSSGKTGAKIP